MVALPLHQDICGQNYDMEPVAYYRQMTRHNSCDGARSDTSRCRDRNIDEGFVALLPAYDCLSN
jgi:hypothetical protein